MVLRRNEDMKNKARMCHKSNQNAKLRTNEELENEQGTRNEFNYLN